MAEGSEEVRVELEAAGAAFDAFASGPVKTAGEAIEAAFAKAGRSIESELTRVARTGEADMERLAASIVATLAKAAIARTLGGGGEESAGPVNVSMNFSGGAGSSDAVASSNQIAAAVARAVARGMRFG